MNKLWVYGPSSVLGDNAIDVATLLEEHGPVRPDFLTKTGFQTLFSAREDQTALDLAVSACEGLGRDWCQDNVDGVIFVSSTSTLTAPGNAHLLQEKLGLRKEIFLLDINDACTGYVRALAVADALITARLATRVLLVAADTYTKLYEQSELKVSPLFSDAASATLISGDSVPNAVATERTWEIVSSTFLSEGDHSGDLCITTDAEHPHGHLSMNGGAVYTFVLRNISGVLDALRAEDPSNEPVSWYVHQGSKMVVTAVEKAVGAEPDSLFRSAGYGNVVQSSIPLQIETVAPSPGSLIGFLGFGVGLTMAGMILREV